MRHKPVPPAPSDLAYLRDVRAAVSLVPREEESCCLRLMERAGVPAEDEARTWLTFLAALGLAEEVEGNGEGVEGKFVRTREPADPTREELAERFLDGVYGARELAGILESADDSLAPPEAFERFREYVPRWERHRADDWELTWRERVGRILAWATLLGVAAERDGGYVPAT